MKKYLISSLLAMVLFVNSGTVFAQNETNTSRDRTRAEIKAKIEAVRSKAEAIQRMKALKLKIGEEKDAASAKIKEIRITGREMALERFDKTVERIIMLRSKINAQITKLEEKGVDVSKAKTYVATSEMKLSDTTVKITEITNVFAASADRLSSEDKAKLVTLTQDTQKLIREAHLALGDALKSLKDALKLKRAESESENETEEN